VGRKTTRSSHIYSLKFLKTFIILKQFKLRKLHNNLILSSAQTIFPPQQQHASLAGKFQCWVVGHHPPHPNTHKSRWPKFFNAMNVTLFKSVVILGVFLSNGFASGNKCLENKSVALDSHRMSLYPLRNNWTNKLESTLSVMASVLTLSNYSRNLLPYSSINFIQIFDYILSFWTDVWIQLKRFLWQ